MRVGLGSELRGIAAHEILAFSVEEARAVGEHPGLPFPREQLGHVPVFDELHVAQGSARAVGQRRAFARAGVQQVRALPAAVVGGEDDGLGPEQAGRAALGVEAHGPGNGVAVLDEIGDLDAPDALDVEPLKLGIEDLRGVRAALAVGMVEVIAHEFEPALGDAHEPAGIVAGELVAHLLVILEALVGLVEDFLKHILLAQPVIVIDQLFDQILGGELRLLDDHVAAGHPAEAAPVAGALVDDEHVLHMLPGRQRGPRTRKAAADDQHVRIENKRFRAHG